jgi:prolyl 4-hydroxylase
MQLSPHDSTELLQLDLLLAFTLPCACWCRYNQRIENGGQRVATVLMYLSTPEEGGETVFPHAENKVSGAGWSDCALKGLAVKAVKGSALLFYSLKPNGQEDQASTHGSCPTLAGEKWSATR